MSQTDDLQVEGPSSHDDSREAGTPVVVRRNAGLAALVGGAASAIAIAYLWRATQDGAPLDWTLCLVMAAIAVLYLANLVDARTPLLVADDLGVRIRLGHQWRGLPWDAVDRVVVQPRRGLVRDGRLMFAPHSLARALDGLDARGRRAAALNQKLYGAALAVPMGLTTRVSAQGDALAEELAALSHGRADVSVLVPEPAQAPADEVEIDETDEAADLDDFLPAEDSTPVDVDEPGTDEAVAEQPAGARRSAWGALARRRARRDEVAADDGAYDEAYDGADEVDEVAAYEPVAEVAHETEPEAVEPAQEVFDWREVVDPASLDTTVAEADEVADHEEWVEEPVEDPAEDFAEQPGAERAEVWAEFPEVDEVDEVDEIDEIDEVDPRPRRVRRSLLGSIGTAVSRAARGRSHDVDADDRSDEVEDPADETQDGLDELPEEPTEQRDETWDDEPDGPVVPVQPAARSAAPLQVARRVLRANAHPEQSAATLGNAALLRDTDAHARRTSLPEGSQLRRGHDDEDFESVRPLVDDDRVRPIARLGDPVDSLVIDDFVTEPAYDPVIGPELAAARTRVGLSVDELAERTRIRPHVIESIEVDDFAPCGGDFYARGHLRTLCRVLGRDPVPLLNLFDNRYATAPINAKRVFEAELATGMTGSMRSTRGGPNWALLIGVVLALVMTWGVIRLFATQPPEVLQPATPVLNGSAGVDSGSGQGAAPVLPNPLKVTLVGAQAGSQVVVRDRAGKVVWAGEVVLGEKRTVSATPPVKVKAADGGAIEVSVAGKDQGTLGLLGEPGTRTFTRPAR